MIYNFLKCHLSFFIFPVIPLCLSIIKLDGWLKSQINTVNDDIQRQRNMHHCHLFFVIQSSQGLPLQICQAKGNDSITALSIPG